MKDTYLEVACPIYGFVRLEPDERRVAESEPFQRLRRIRQLGWTDAVFPGAMHTRFEHSLGVLQMVSNLFDGLRQQNEDVLLERLSLERSDLDRWRKRLRLAALLHDIGHGPFSHVAEAVTPGDSNTGKRFRHEHYSL